MRFVAAGFDLGVFWRLTPRSYVLMMRGAVERSRAQRLSMAEAVRAASHLDADDFEKWVTAVSGRDLRLPPDVLDGALRRSSNGMEVITMGKALSRMH